MNNLSFHITDIASNSIRAKAAVVEIAIREDARWITLCITDNGCGMDAGTVAQVRNPFYTTRTTRKVGLGLPFLIQNAEQTGGQVEIVSEPGKGTTVTARFAARSIDLPPWGDLPGTIAALMTGNPDTDICFSYGKDEEEPFTLSTHEVKEALDGMPLSYPSVMLWLREMIRENVVCSTRTGS